AWADYSSAFDTEKSEALAHISNFNNETAKRLAVELKNNKEATLKDIYGTVRKVIRLIRNENSIAKKHLLSWYEENQRVNDDRFHSKLFTDGIHGPDQVTVVPVAYANDVKMVDGREVLNACFEENFKRDSRLFAFGEDVGAIGDVNQGFAGLQKKFGEERIFDTGIRESTIIGQGIGMATRGLRPIAEV